MQSKHILDEEKRCPEDPEYDPSTLHIPPSDYNSLTDGMKRYWGIKSKNFDKIVFYRYGHWFIVYYQDAMTCNKFIDLCIPPRQRQHIVGFHESHLQDNIETLVNAGHKVAICEQTENGVEMDARIKEEMKLMTQEEKKTVIKAIHREVA